MFETICTVMGATLLFVATCIVAAKAVIGLWHMLFKDDEC